MEDDEDRELQEALVSRPDMGALIPGSGGLRKARWKSQKKGKSGGVRIIYYWVTANHQIRMLYIYSKGTQEDLSKRQVAVLRKIIERW